eukprot:1464867-Pleurochrysis_carterae.AAC.7
MLSFLASEASGPGLRRVPAPVASPAFSCLSAFGRSCRSLSACSSAPSSSSALRSRLPASSPERELVRCERREARLNAEIHLALLLRAQARWSHRVCGRTSSLVALDCACAASDAVLRLRACRVEAAAARVQ